MKRLTLLLILITLPFISFGFKEVHLNKGLEVGFGYTYVYKGVGAELGYEVRLSDKVDIYPWITIGGYGPNFGFGAQIDFPIKVFKQDIFSIAVAPFGGVDFKFEQNRQNETVFSFDFDIGAYGLFSLDFRKENVPLSLSIGFGPDISLSANPNFSAFFTVNLSFYIDNLTIQIGGNSKFAGVALKINL
jgi:hypothetical protein